MIKQIKCKCGKELKFDYISPLVITTSLFGGKVSKVYSFRCDGCGQEYLEEAKDVIWLK